MCRSYSQHDHRRLVRQKGPQKSNKDVGISARVHAAFLFLSLRHPCSFLISISSFGLCANFPSRDATLEHRVVCPFIVLLFFASSASLYLVVSHTGCKNLEKKKKWDFILVQHGVKEQYQVFTGSASGDSEVRKAFECSV